MTLQALPAPRFVRRTRLGPNEYRKNFHQIDREVLAVITSEEADRVTPLMSKIYLRMVNAPERFWEREGVLRIEAEVRDGKVLKAWSVLCDLVGVASATANKAIAWMHEQGIIGYFSGKNGVGLRIFLNRALSSIGVRSRQCSEKILAFPPASSCGALASKNEPAFSDSFAVSESSEINLNPAAPNGGAGKAGAKKILADELPTLLQRPTRRGAFEERAPQPPLPVEEIVTRLRLALEPSLRSAARQAATQEHERTREWLESRGLPKAARVAQREAFNVLRQHGLVGAGASARAGLEVGRHANEPRGARPLSPEELRETAETCVAMLEIQGRSLDGTLAELDTAAGGFLLAEDVPKVRELAEAMINAGGSR